MNRAGPAKQGALTKLFLTNTASNLLLRVFSAVLALVATRAMIHHYGDERFALLALAVQVSGLLGVLAPGLSGAYSREMADRSGRGNPDTLWELLRLGTLLYLGVGLLLGSVLVLFGATGAVSWLKVTAEHLPEAALIFIVAGVFLAVRWPLSVFADTLAGLQQYPRLALVRSITAIGYSSSALLVVWLDRPLVLVLGLQGVIWLCEGAVLRALARRCMPPREGLKTPSRRELFRSLFEVGGYMAILEVAGLIHYQTDSVVLAGFVSTSAVTAYLVTAKLHGIVREFQGTLGSALTPLVARESAGGNDAAVEQVIYRGTRYLLAIVLPVALTAVLSSSDFLRVWMGPGWERWGWWAGLFAGYLALAFVTSFVGQAAVGSGKVAPLAWIALLCAGVNIALSVALAPRYGVGGVISATLIAYALALPLQVLFLFPRLGVSCGRFLREVVLPIYPAALVLMGGLYFVKVRIGLIETLPALLLWGAFSGSCFALLFFLVAVDARDRQRLLNFVRRRKAGP